MRRYGPILLFLAVLLIPFVLRSALVKKPAARSNDSLRLIVVTPHNQDIRREFQRAFDAWHREHYGAAVEIDYRTPGGTTDIERLLRSTYQANRDEKTGKLRDGFSPDLDLVWGGGDFFFDQTLKPLGVLQPMQLDSKLLKAAFPEPTIAGVRLFDSSKAGGTPAPQWVGVCLSSFGIIYNPDLFASLQIAAPTTWHDLADERLYGFVALADPSHSGSAAVAYMMVLQRAMADSEEAHFAANPSAARMDKAARAKDPAYQRAIAAGWKRGMSDLLRIAANARYFSDDAQTVPTDVSRGDAAAGMAIDFYARVTEQIVGSSRARFIAPARATAVTPDPVAILAGVDGDRKVLATRFVEFLLSTEGQRLWILKRGTPGGPVDRGLGRSPIRRDVYADRTGWQEAPDPFEQAGNFNQRAEWMGLFNDTRTIWFAAWIDGRDALRDAFDVIRNVPDAERRKTLLDKLADLPVEMKDVAALREQKKKQSTDSADAWYARQRIDWAIKFRNHYAAVMREAQSP